MLPAQGILSIGRKYARERSLVYRKRVVWCTKRDEFLPLVCKANYLDAFTAYDCSSPDQKEARVRCSGRENQAPDRLLKINRGALALGGAWGVA